MWPGRARWNRLNDCETDAQGSFRVHEHDRSSWRSLALSCVVQCRRCSRCVHLSVSLDYGVCSWYASNCSFPATADMPRPGVAFAGTWLKQNGGRPGGAAIAGLNGSLFRSARLLQQDVATLWKQSDLDFMSRYSQTKTPPSPPPPPPSEVARHAAAATRLLLVTTTYSSPSQLHSAS